MCVLCTCRKKWKRASLAGCEHLKKGKYKIKRKDTLYWWSMKSLRKRLSFPLQPIITCSTNTNPPSLSIAFNIYQLIVSKLYVLQTDPKNFFFWFLLTHTGKRKRKNVWLLNLPVVACLFYGSLVNIILWQFISKGFLSYI